MLRLEIQRLSRSFCLFNALAYFIGVDFDYAGLSVALIGDYADLRTGKRYCFISQFMYAIAKSATDICSPVDKSISISRSEGLLVIWLANSNQFISCIP